MNKNPGGMFSFEELSKLQAFCNKCAKEDKIIYEKRRSNTCNAFYIPEQKKIEPIKQKKAPSNKEIQLINKHKLNYKPNKGDVFVKNNCLKDVDDKDIFLILNHNSSYKKPNNDLQKKPDSFKNRIKMFEPKK